MFQEEDEFEFKEEDDDFVFGYQQLEQIGGMRESVEDEILRTNVEGMNVFIQLDPDQKFRQELNILLMQDEFKKLLAGMDTSMLKKQISNICLIKYKSPLLYILGFYLYRDVVIEDGKIQRKSSLEKKLKNIGKLMKQYSKQDVLRYAQMWNNIFLTQHRLICQRSNLFGYDLKISK